MAMIQMARRKGISFVDKVVPEEDQLAELAEGIEQIEDRDVAVNTKNKFQFRRWPFEEWIGGSILIIMAIILFQIFEYEEEMKNVDHHWIKWLAMAVLTFLGFCWVMHGKVKTVVFEK